MTCVCALATAPAWGAGPRPGDGDLSPRLAELAKPAVRSAPPARQAKALSLAAEGPGSLVREGDRVLVEVRFDRGAAAGADALRAAGTKIVDVSPRSQMVTVAVRPAELEQLVAVPRLEAATEVLAPMVHGAGSVAAATTPCFGAATSEGDHHLNVAQARVEFGIDGSGVTVGVLSDSFDEDASAATHKAEDIASGDLPGPGNPCGRTTPVTVLSDFDSPESSDEGRGMAQIVHDLAPGARLSFATAFTGLNAFASNVKALAAAGAETIVDDVSYFEEPFFQEGPVGAATSEVTEAGVSYFSSAGNNNLISAGRDIASWEAPQFRDAASCPAGAPGYTAHCMDFDPDAGVDSTFGVKVSSGATLRVDLQWAQPWNGVTTDLDAYLLDPTNSVIAESENFNVTDTQRPFEFFAWENLTGAAQTVRIAINRCDLACDGGNGGDQASPRLKLALLQNGGGVTESEYPESSEGDLVGPTIFGHNGAEDALSVGAVRYSTTVAPESFSSRGPVAHYFGPVDGVGPAAPLPSPHLLAKPDLAATDCGRTTFFVPTSTPSIYRFCGTSAAAPHAAAVAALLRGGDATLSPADTSEILRHTARPVGGFGPEAVGAGLIDAFAAAAQADIVQGSSAEATESLPDEESMPSVISGGTPQSTLRDRTAPRTGFRRKPPKLLLTPWRRGKAVFGFRSNEAGVAYLCQFDRKRYRRCPERSVRWFLRGRHVLRVRARDGAGNVDPTPAVYRFRVKRGKPGRVARRSG